MSLWLFDIVDGLREIKVRVGNVWSRLRLIRVGWLMVLEN